MDRNPLGDGQDQPKQQQDQDGRQRSVANARLLSPSDFCLVLRPEIGSDEHLLPIHEGSWTPDGNVWFQAKISLLQGGTQHAVAAAADVEGGPTDGLELPRHGECHRESCGESEASSGGGTGLSVTLRPEGEGQRRARLEGEATAAMILEDERSRRVGGGVSRLEKDAAGKAGAAEEKRRSSRLAAVVFTAKVSGAFKLPDASSTRM